jgi:hypothetical protein
MTPNAFILKAHDNVLHSENPAHKRLAQSCEYLICRCQCCLATPATGAVDGGRMARPNDELAVNSRA